MNIVNENDIGGLNVVIEVEGAHAEVDQWICEDVIYSDPEIVEDVWTYERIMEIWNEDSIELTPQLARRCKRQEELLKEIRQICKDEGFENCDIVWKIEEELEIDKWDD